MSLQEKIQAEVKKEIGLNQVVEKKFKFPFFKKVRGTSRKKNYVTTLVLNENRTYVFQKYQITEQTILHDLIPRLATAGHVMFDKRGNPLIILPNWSVEPFSPLEHYNQSMISGTNTKGYKILMAKMQSEQAGKKKEMGGLIKWILGAGLLGIIVYAFLG